MCVAAQDVALPKASAGSSFPTGLRQAAEASAWALAILDPSADLAGADMMPDMVERARCMCSQVRGC